MNNLIDYKVPSKKLENIRKAKAKKKSKKSFSAKVIFSLTMVVLTIASTFFYFSSIEKAQAVQFGLGNNYDEILELNDEFSNNVPLSTGSISTESVKGDKRVIALYLFLQKYKSPMATPSIAKAFIDGADANGFGTKWYLLPAISGIESAFGRMIPRTGNVLSYNGWGWSGGSKYGRWSYFNSWEHAAEVISKGLAEGYKETGLDPVKIMVNYCPPCARPESKGVWAKTVNRYSDEMMGIYKSL